MATVQVHETRRLVQFKGNFALRSISGDKWDRKMQGEKETEATARQVLNHPAPFAISASANQLRYLSIFSRKVRTQTVHIYTECRKAHRLMARYLRIIV